MVLEHHPTRLVFVFCQAAFLATQALNPVHVLCLPSTGGICPTGTAANFWELGRPDFSLGFGPGGLSNDLFDDEFPFINPLPIVAASTDCGTDLQVGGGYTDSLIGYFSLLIKF